MSLTLDKYMQAVNAKLNDPVTRRLMQFGSMNPNAKQIRSEKGMIQAEELVRNSAEHLFYATDGRDAFAKEVHNFSDTDSGYSQVSDVRTLGAIDVTILYLSNSLIPFVCMDRALDDPDSTVYYNNLIAINKAGGLEAGEIANGNFMAPNLDVDLGSTKIVSDKASVREFGVSNGINSAITRGTVVITVLDGEGNVVASGKDYASDGTVYITDAKTKAPVGYYGVVDYNTGNVKIEGAEVDGASIKVSAERDLSYGDGEQVLRVTPDYVPIQLHTEPKVVIVENSIQNKMYMKKIANRAGSNRDLSEDTFTRAKNMVIEYMNVLVLRTIKAECTNAAAVLDFSTYDTNRYAATKADMVQLFISGLQARFLARTGVDATTIITGVYGVTLLRSIPGMWSDNPDAVDGPNGLAGYYASIPVYRHNEINNAQPQIADFYLTCKLPDNSSGTAIFGEYLPLTGTGSVSNFKLPLKISEGYFAMNGVKVVSNRLILKGTVVLPVSMFDTRSWKDGYR